MVVNLTADIAIAVKKFAKKKLRNQTKIYLDFGKLNCDPVVEHAARLFHTKANQPVRFSDEHGRLYEAIIS